MLRPALAELSLLRQALLLSSLCCIRLSLVVVHELLIVVAPLIAEHELQGEWAQELWCTGSAGPWHV